MRTIKKFKLERITDPVVLMPKGSQILKISSDTRHRPILWAICRDDVPIVKRLVRIFWSGDALPDEPGQYLNTISFLGDELHCFDGGESYE